jgi:hypothetical protein
MLVFLINLFSMFVAYMNEKRSLSPLTRAIQALGMSPKDFAEQKLGTKYQSFRYRARNGALRLGEYHKILQLTGRTFEELFPSPYATTKRIPLNLSIGAHPQPTITTRLTPDGPREEPLNAIPPGPIPSVYENGLPPID